MSDEDKQGGEKEEDAESQRNGCNGEEEREKQSES